MISHCYCDLLVWAGGCAWPLATVWGDIAHTYEIMDGCLEILCGPVLQQESLVSESFGLPLGISMIGSFAHHCNMPAEQRIKVAGFLNEFGATWTAADATMDTATSVFVAWIRARGLKVKGQHYVSVGQLSWLTKCAWYLCAQEPGVSAAEVTASLPSIEEMIEMSPSPAADTCANWTFYNPIVNVACVWEKLGRPEDALRYATAALENDLARCGTVAPINRISAHLVQGRAQASLRHFQAAADAFEAAVELADKHGLQLFQALALKDLKLCVLDPLGHSEHGSRRLGEALRRLVGPADMLAPLMDGLDVVGLMALPPPSQDHHIGFDDESVEHNAKLHSQDCLAQPEPVPHGTTQPETTLPEGTPPSRQQVLADQCGGVSNSSGPSGTTRTLTLLITSELFDGKKKVRVSASSVSELSTHLQAELRLSTSFSIFVHDEDFDEERMILELEDFDKDKAKIRLVES